jgi:hypothetical protein
LVGASCYLRIKSSSSEKASGGAAAILASLDPRVKRVIANWPVVDWKILDRSEKVRTSKEHHAKYIREAFGNGFF